MNPPGHHDLRARRGSVRHQCRFRQGRGPVVDRSIGHVHAAELGDHGLVLKDRPQCSLAGLGLIGRVSREKLAARDEMVDGAGDVMIVGATPEKAAIGVGVGVLISQVTQMVDEVGLGERGGEGQRSRQARLGGYAHQQILDGAGADDVEHEPLLVASVRDVSHGLVPGLSDERLVLLGAEKFGHLGGIGDGDYDHPAAAIRVLIDQLRRIDQLCVDLNDLARQWCEEIGHGFDGLHHAEPLVLGNRGPHLGQLNEDHVTELLLRVGGDPYPGPITLDLCPLVLLRVLSV